MPFSFNEFTDKADKIIKHIATDLATIRTGRASAQMLDGVMVEVQSYKMTMKLNEIANIDSPNPQQITVNPWDKSLLGDIEKAIASSGLNLSPVVSSDHIFINVPPLTEERRLEMVKLLQQKLEASKVLIRTLRTDTKKDIEKQKGQVGVSEDDIFTEIKDLDERTESYLSKVEAMGIAKKKELMTI